MVTLSCDSTRAALSGVSARLPGIWFPLVASLPPVPLVLPSVAAEVGANIILDHVVLPMHVCQSSLLLYSATLIFLASVALHWLPLPMISDLCTRHPGALRHCQCH